jgi:hypothetical protein
VAARPASADRGGHRGAAAAAASGRAPAGLGGLGARAARLMAAVGTVLRSWLAPIPPCLGTGRVTLGEVS